MALFITCVVGKWSIYIWVFSVTRGVGGGGGITSRAHICSNHSKAQSLWRCDRRGKSVLNHLQRNCFSNNLFGLTTKKIKDPLWGEYASDWWSPLTNAQWWGKRFHVMIISWSSSDEVIVGKHRLLHIQYLHRVIVLRLAVSLSKMKIFSSKSC